MRLEQIDLNLFVVFDAIYSERNLTRVSERLSVTQPAISNALARLRHSLNDQLFVRTPKGMKPTPLAETIVEPVRQALHLLNTGIQLSGLFDPAHSKRTFKLSVSRGVESRVLLPLMEYLQHHAPNVAISSYDINRADLPLELSSGTVDLAVNVPLIRDPNLNSVLIAGDPYVCLMRDNHPDAGCNLSFERYLALDHVHISSRRSGAGYVDTKLAQLGAQRRIKFRTSNYELAAD
ncbi:MAG: LysR family transcriptional regulator, partial [Chloroflexota bacterium]